jgi:hypothetical protein
MICAARVNLLILAAHHFDNTTRLDKRRSGKKPVRMDWNPHKRKQGHTNLHRDGTGGFSFFNFFERLRLCLSNLLLLLRGSRAIVIN